MNALIGSGFFAANESDFDKKFDFLSTVWLPRLIGRDIVIVDNTEPPTKKISVVAYFPNLRVVPVVKNIGHVGSHLGQYRPHVLGFTMSWMIPAQIAYSEGRDFMYVEADALMFGDCEAEIVKEMDEKKLAMAFGHGSRWASTEQSVFYIRHEFITEAIWLYLSIPEGDGMILPEDKFRMMAECNFRVGRYSLGCGRNRPLTYDTPVWTAQKFTDEEMVELRNRKLI